MFLLVNGLLSWMKLMNCSGSFSWVIFSIGLYHFITGSAECSFLWCFLQATMSTAYLFHATFSKSILCIPKIRTQAMQVKRLVFLLLLFSLQFFWAVCLILNSSGAAPTSWCRSLFTSWVTGHEVRIQTPIVRCLSYCCWDVMWFAGWEVAVMLFHSKKAYGTMWCNREESWWVNDESFSLRQHSVLSQNKNKIWNQLKVSVWRFQTLL